MAEDRDYKVHTMTPKPRPRVATQVLDFTVLPIRQPSTPSFTKETTHYLYIRGNAPRLPTEENPRELFLANVPVDATETHIKSLFAESLGGVRLESVSFADARVGKGIKAPVVHAKKRKRGAEDGEAGEEIGQLPYIWDREVHRSGGTAVVRCVDRQSAEIALREAKKVSRGSREIIWGHGIEGKVPALGRARYKAHHDLRYPDHAALQASVDQFMEVFSAQETERARALARQRSEPDEDGFVTVTRGGRAGPAREEDARLKEEELKKREKNRVKNDFYRFQLREKQKERAKELVKGFEEDRRRVDEMKGRRGKVRPERWAT